MTQETKTSQLHWYNHLFINVNWFSLTLRTQVLSGLLVPLLVLKFVGEAQKGTYFGTIRLWALLVALIMQAFFGLLSDRSQSKWGRRRPYIFLGTILEVFVILSMTNPKNAIPPHVAPFTIGSILMLLAGSIGPLTG